MSIHKGGEVWAGKCIEYANADHMLHGSGNMAHDEGTNIGWGFYLSENVTFNELIDMMNKIQEEITTHPHVDRFRNEGLMN